MKLTALSMLLAASASVSGAATIVSVPAPAGEPVVTEYQVTVNDQPVALYTSRDQYWEKEYYFGTFDFEGNVEVRVKSAKSLAKVQMLPQRPGMEPTLLSDNELSFKADQPFRISIERDGRVRPLLLFANPLEKDAPKEGDPNVIYFGPGIHKAGKITLTSDQTLYIAAGAIVNGGVDACGNNIIVRGRGILAGDIYERFKGPCSHSCLFHDCQNVTCRDIIFRNPWSWTLVTHNCSDVTIDNVKICGSNMINDDAVDLCNTSYATVRNCFLRTQDDIIAIKGTSGKNRNACTDILIENCEFWTDRANIFRIGYECACPTMRNLIARNLEILHYAPYSAPSQYWSHAIIWLQPSDKMPLSDMHFYNFTVHSDGSDMCLLIAKTQVCKWGKTEITESGSIERCVLSNINVVGTKGKFRGELHFEGRSEKEYVKDITVENVTYFGEKITAEYPFVTKLKNVSNIIIK